MEISKVEVDTYQIPLPEPVEAFAAGVMKAFDLVICKVTNDNNEQGVGYITVHENQGLAITSIIKSSFKLIIDFYTVRVCSDCVIRLSLVLKGVSEIE